MKLLPKLPETVTDQVMLCFVLILFGFSCAIIRLGMQQKPIPVEFKEISTHIATGVFAALTFKKISE